MISFRWFLLNSAQAVFLAFWSALWISVAGFFSLFSREFPLVLARRAWGPGLIRASLAKVVVVSAAELDPRKGYVFVMNHQSMYDIAVGFTVIPRNLRFVAKRILLFVPFIGFYLWRMGMVLVDRKNPRDAYSRLGRAAQQLRNGDCFLAYPEGTRSVDGKIHAFKRGSFVTAIQAGAPVVPVAIDGSGQVLPRGGFNLRPDVVRVAIGAPIPTTGLTDADVPALIRRARSEMIALHRSIGGLGGDEEESAASSILASENSGEESIEEMPWQEARP
jgi:1-acyl-sn-glycerol-3-phosphate acyltransferase